MRRPGHGAAEGEGAAAQGGTQQQQQQPLSTEEQFSWKAFLLNVLLWGVILQVPIFFLLPRIFPFSLAGTIITGVVMWFLPPVGWLRPTPFSDMPSNRPQQRG